MGQLDILPNTPRLWQAIAHPLVRSPLAKVLRVFPNPAAGPGATLKIGPLSLAALDGHLDHVLGKACAQGSSAIKTLAAGHQVGDFS